MEVELVHTTGSPSRHDSDSESSYDKKRQTISSSDMALNRKQSRRCKKQMSERQRRKRMNNFMDKLGLLVYGKTFKDGLKVDKATLLKGAYEKLQTMKDDYHRGYETAITSAQSFLDRLEGCPPEVKDALSQHLKNTLQVHHCHSTTSSTFPPEDSHSDSGSPQPPKSSSLQSQDFNLDARRVPSALSPQPLWSSSLPSQDLYLDTRPAPSRLSPKSCGQWLMPGAPGASEERLASVSVQFGSRMSSSSSSRVHQGETMVSPRKTMTQLAPAPSSTSIDVSGGGGDVEVSRVPRSASPKSSFLGALPSSPLSTSSQSGGVGSVGESSSADHHTSRQDKSGSGHFPPYPFPYFSYTLSDTISSSSSTTTTSTPKISPYVTPYAPKDPLYLGSALPSLIYGVPLGSSPSSRGFGVPRESSFSGSHSISNHPYSILHPHTPGHYVPGPSRADDSGYISPVVPSPHTPAGSGRGVGAYGSVKKRYLKEVMGRFSKMKETDEENDKEVEQVLSRPIKHESDSE